MQIFRFCLDWRKKCADRGIRYLVVINRSWVNLCVAGDFSYCLLWLVMDSLPRYGSENNLSYIMISSNLTKNSSEFMRYIFLRISYQNIKSSLGFFHAFFHKIVLFKCLESYSYELWLILFVFIFFSAFLLLFKSLRFSTVITPLCYLKSGFRMSIHMFIFECLILLFHFLFTYNLLLCLCLLSLFKVLLIPSVKHRRRL